MNIVACRDRKQSPNAMWRAYLAVTVLTDPNNTEKSPAIVGHAFLNSRFYDSQRGQFLSEDPVFWEVGQTQDGKNALSDPQSMNAYSYANNNPITKSDPKGRWLELSGSAVVFNRAFSTGIRFDGNGIDWFMAGGYGVGVEAGVQVAWAPQQQLSHDPQASVSGVVTGADGIGVQLSQNLLTYSGSQKKVVSNGDPSLAIVLGGGYAGSIQNEYSSPVPYLVWNKPQPQISFEELAAIPTTISAARQATSRTENLNKSSPEITVSQIQQTLSRLYNALSNLGSALNSNKSTKKQ